MNDMLAMLERWELDVNTVRERVYRAPTPRERERWHALWLLARGWSAAQVAEALQRDAVLATCPIHHGGGGVPAHLDQIREYYRLQDGTAMIGTRPHGP